MLQLQIDTEGFNETKIQGYTTIYLVKREGLPNLLVAYCLLRCCPCNEAAGPQKSGILLLACESSMMGVVSRIQFSSWCNV